MDKWNRMRKRVGMRARKEQEQSGWKDNQKNSFAKDLVAKGVFPKNTTIYTCGGAAADPQAGVQSMLPSPKSNTHFNLF